MSEPRQILLIVDDDVGYTDALTTALGQEYTVRIANSEQEAAGLLGNDVDLALVDIRLGSDSNNRGGLRLLEQIRATDENLPIVVMTSYADIDIAVEAMRLGATDFVQKAHTEIRELKKTLRNAVHRSRQNQRIISLEDELRRLDPWEMVGDDPKIGEVRELINLVAADAYCTALIRGDTGTGKELVARAIYERGRRKGAPFVAVSVPALPRELIETELFGHVKGAFTDAQGPRVGYVEKAKGGVLFLDEIGDLSGDVQVKLLRFLETKTFARVGSSDEITIDVQVVAATNRNLEEAIESGAFRKDLYFRLKTMEIRLPCLSERVADIPLLVDHFLSQFRQQGRTRLAGISPAALERLEQYSFPGNVRELRAMVERAMIVAGSQRHKMLDATDLPLEVQRRIHGSHDAPTVSIPEAGIDLDEELARIELSYIQKALEVADGKKDDAWRILGLNDRFAMRRRAKRIGDAYPHLIRDCPLIERSYFS